MTKTEAYEIFGSRVQMAKALEVTGQRVSQWPDELKRDQEDRVLGAAVRLRLSVPQWDLKFE